MKTRWTGLGGAMLAATLSCGAATAAATPASPELAGVTVAGADLRLALSDGQVLAGERLVGAVISLRAGEGAYLRVKVESVAPDPRDKTGEVTLYRFTAEAPSGAWLPICSPDPDGHPLATVQAGKDGRLMIWCTAGALAKCVRFGYHPWRSLPDGTPLARFHRACVNLMRGDYTGDDRPTTRNGMYIEIYDRVGIQAPEPEAGRMPFEAAWGEHGALCVAHARVPQNISLEGLVARDPRFQNRTGEVCTEDTALTMGEVLLYNRSRGDGIPGR